MRILVFDNYDSFTYNLVHLVEAITGTGGVAIGVSADMSTAEGIEHAVAETTTSLGPPLIVVTQADFHVRGFFDEVTRDVEVLRP